MIYTANRWTVEFSRKASKQAGKLDVSILAALRLLVEDLKNYGPTPGRGWPNCGKLHGKKNEDKRHCHLIKGKPTYVCCWELIDKKIRIIEIYYVGTHEKAPY